MRFDRSVSYFWRASLSIISRSGHKLLLFPQAKEPQANLLFPVVAVLLVATFFGTQKEVTVSADDRSVVIKTHLDNVGAVLADAGITIESGDIVSPPPSASLSEGRSISIKRSKPVLVHADGTTYSFRTQGNSVAEAMREGGIDLRQEDAIYLGGRQVAQNADLAALKPGNAPRGSPVMVDNSRAIPVLLGSLVEERDRALTGLEIGQPVELTVERAVPVYLHDGETHGSLYTTRQVLDDALSDQGIVVYEEDLVFPKLSTQVAAGMHVFLLRAKPITIKVDGRTIEARTQAKTIEEAILQEAVKLVGKDRTEPARDALVESNVVVRITRVKEEVITEHALIDFSVENRPDPATELDERRVMQEGSYGLRKWETRIVYENGEEVSRTIVRQWIETPPTNKVIGYGTKIVIRELNSPEGTFSYWRKFRMWGTSYNASHGGKSRDNPAYGITRTGMKLTRGIVAIDPNVIPFYTRVYVPGYGVGLAADTGGGIRGMMIDLGFEETDTNMWSAHWTDVYLLTPVPPPNEILYRIFG